MCHFQCFGLLPIHLTFFSTSSSSSYTGSSLPSSYSSPYVRSLCCLPPPDQSLTQEKQRQMFQEHTTAPTPTPPICTGSAVNPRKELTIQARTHTYKEHRCTNLYGLNSCPTEWTIHTHTHTHIYTHTASAVQSPSVSLIVATQGSGLVSASRAEGLSGQLAWLILLLEATGSQTKSQGPPGGHRAGIPGRRESVICLKCKGFFLFCLL